MWRYYFRLGLRSLKRNPFLTTLMVLILGFGVGASMTAYTVMHVLGGDPMPHKSSQLFVPQLDTQPADNYEEGDEPDRQLGYLDVDRFLRAGKGSNRAAVYGISPTIDANRKDLPPFGEPGLAMTRGFFELFETPFRFGGPWRRRRCRRVRRRDRQQAVGKALRQHRPDRTQRAHGRSRLPHRRRARTLESDSEVLSPAQRRRSDRGRAGHAAVPQRGRARVAQ
jgi:hypothetical protein